MKPLMKTLMKTMHIAPTMLVAGALSLAAALSSAVPLVGSAQADDPTRRLKSLEQELQETRKRHSDLARRAEDVAAEVKSLKQRMVRAAGEAQRFEAEMTRIEGRTLDLSARIAAANVSWSTKRTQMVALLAALERVAQHPPVALAARPGDPADTLRTALLIRAAVPALKDRSSALRREIKELEGLRTELSRQRIQLRVSEKALTAQRDELARLVQIKTRIERTTRAESSAAHRRAMVLAGEADDLKGLLAKLEAERREQERLAAARRAEERRNQRQLAKRRRLEEQRLEQQRLAQERLARERAIAAQRRLERQQAARLDDAAKAKRGRAAARTEESGGKSSAANSSVTLSVASLATVSPRIRALPAQGRLIRKFGQRTGIGRGAAKGLSIRTRRAAQVVAPRGGEVVFAGPFRGYGQLLILRHDDGYHVLLSGMARIDAVVGDRVLAGEPVGTMTSNSNTQPTLYVELRRNGQPINPMPWLSASRSKVDG